MTITALQLPSSYNFNLELVDPDPLTFLLVVKDSEDTPIYNNETYETNTEVTVSSTSAGTYTIEVYEWVDDEWVFFDDSSITILEYQMDINWTYTVGVNYQIDPTETYTYLPDAFTYNNNACPTPALYPSQITYSLYDLIDEEWVLRSGSTTTISLTDWEDGDPDYNLLEYEYTTEGYPLKIITTVSNCNQTITNDTYVDQEFLITSIDAVNTHSEIQTEASYTITFNYSFGNEDGDNPMLVITPENSSYTKCNLFIYKNGEVIHTYEGLAPTQFYPYTFADPTIIGNGGTQYQVKYISTNGVDSFEEIFPFTVQEYKPTFNLPTIQCLKINEPATITLGSLRFNCFANDEDLHFLPPEFTPNINYKLFYLNSNTYTWEPINGDTIEEYSGVDSTGLPAAAEDFIDENVDATDTTTSIFLQNKYRYGSSDTELWTPNRLSMVKMVVTVTNYSTSVMKETIFPICGTWKIRRMSCGKYRIYNYTANPINFIIEKSNNGTFSQFKTLQVGTLSFDSLELPDDGIYKVTGGGLTKYIFNFCALENCILELQKKVLLDDTLCDACKLDKVLYQKALRILPVYETWKKLLDRDWVYEIQYQSTDVAGSLVAIYDAEELYLELKDLCDSCDYKSEKCKCK